MKSLKNCPYLRIKEVEETIEREKQVLFFMQTEIMKWEKALKKADVETLYKLDKTYYDGFSWSATSLDSQSLEIPLAIEQLHSKEELQKKCRDCPYLKQNCQELLDLKKSRIGFLRKKTMEAIGYHNQILGLLQVAFNGYMNSSCQKDNLYMVFHKNMRPSLVFFNIEQFKPAETGYGTSCLVYQDEKSLEIQKEWVSYEYQVRSKALEGTYLGGGHETLKLIKVCLPSGNIKGFEVSIMHAMNRLIKTLNKRFGRRYGQIQGIYIELTGYSPSYQMKLISLLGSLDYKVLGKMNHQGIFEEKKLLLYLPKSQKKIDTL